MNSTFAKLFAAAASLPLSCAIVLGASAPPPDINYDESKVGSYTLPDPLVCADGTKVRLNSIDATNAKLRVNAIGEKILASTR